VEPSPLHYVVAFIQPFQLDAVVDAIRQLPNFPGMSVSEVRGFGSRAAHPPRVGELAEVDPFKLKVRIEIFCRPAELVVIVETIRQAAHTGNPGDGKIFAGPVSLAHRVRTGEWGEGAVLRPAAKA